ERCLAAGMDGYLSKPIRGKDLIDLVEGLPKAADPANPLPAAAPSFPTHSGVETDAGTPLFDESVLLDRVGGDIEVAAELASAFLAESPGLLEAVRQAVQSKNPMALNRAAHALKGAVANFGVNSAVQSALALEELGLSGHVRGAAGRLAHLESQILVVTGKL